MDLTEDEVFLWNERETLYTKEDPYTKYSKSLGKKTTPYVWGQRKLGLTLLQFLTIYWDPEKIKTPTLLYIGASPGVGINHVMSTYFPEFKCIYYDPRKMHISGENVKIIKKIFTYDDAKKYSGRDDIFLVIDIRSEIADSGNDIEKIYENERKIVKDMKFQMDIYEIIKPVKAQLKFRLPFYFDDQEYLENIPRYYEYLYGTIYKQPYVGSTSTECRLVPEDNMKIKYDIKLYEGQLFHHNINIRALGKFTNPILTNDFTIRKSGENPEITFHSDEHPYTVSNEIDDSYDTVYEAWIFLSFLRKYDSNLVDLTESDYEEISIKIQIMSQLLTDNINKYYERLGRPKVTLSQLKNV